MGDDAFTGLALAVAGAGQPRREFVSMGLGRHGKGVLVRAIRHPRKRIRPPDGLRERAIDWGTPFSSIFPVPLPTALSRRQFGDKRVLQAKRPRRPFEEITMSSCQG